MLGFVIFLAFESYDTSRSGAESEAEITMQQFETAQFMPAAVRAQLSGELVCYARTVVHEEWPDMKSGGLGNAINPWGVAMFKTMQTVEPQSNSEQTAFDKWFDQRSDRENARQDRVHGAEGVIPLPLWIVLLLTAVIIFFFMLFFADSAESVGRPGNDDGRDRGRRHLDAAAAVVPRQPVPVVDRRPASDGDGAHARPHGSGCEGRWPRARSAVRLNGVAS